MVQERMRTLFSEKKFKNNIKLNRKYLITYNV